ncbi:hypothetical protein MPER_03032, partial [Moniliophthora perniciosa FA553]
MLMGMFSAFCPDGRIDFDIGAFFEPYVRQWLTNTENKTENWVQAGVILAYLRDRLQAIAADKVILSSLTRSSYADHPLSSKPKGAEGHSSSIVDLFDSLRSPITFLQDLEWDDEYQNARFFTALSKTISKAVEQYCRSIETMFLSEMFPRPNDYLQPQKSSAWLEKARQLAIQGEKKVEPFNFQPETCVKLNNVEGARKLLDN